MVVTLTGVKPLDFTADDGKKVKGSRIAYYYPHPDWYGNKSEIKFIAESSSFHKTLSRLLNTLTDDELDCLAIPISVDFDGDGKLIGLSLIPQPQQ